MKTKIGERSQQSNSYMSAADVLVETDTTKLLEVEITRGHSVTEAIDLLQI